MALAHAHGVQVNPHVWASAVGQAASLQLIASIPVANHSLFPKDILLEFDTSSHPFRNELTNDPLDRKTAGWRSRRSRALALKSTENHSGEIRRVKPANLLIIMSDEHDPRWMGCRATG